MIMSAIPLGMLVSLGQHVIVVSKANEIESRGFEIEAGDPIREVNQTFYLNDGSVLTTQELKILLI